ncbi:MAG: molybdopterin-dependent oxidoreductase [Novosphingobium sp.]|nr:molybdopterin-dependent oxidoreductase [Novosphingobium sp.]
MGKQVHSFCRICEPTCPLIADIDDTGKVTALRPDSTHPSGGIACHKGLSFLEVHNDPDRLNWPQRRLNLRTEAEGDYAQVGWDEALADIGGRMKSIRDEHGPNSIAVYVGNPMVFDTTGAMMAEMFKNTLGTLMRFSSNTQDTQNKVIAAGEAFGSLGSFTVPDLQNTDYLLCLGSNPRVSRWTVMSMPNDDVDVLRRIRGRGGKIRFVNPRRVESSTEETGPTLRIKPGTDVYFLIALLNEIELKGGFREDLLQEHGIHVNELKAFARRYPAERVAGVIGIPAETVSEIAGEIIAARSACIFLSTGVNQSRQGVLAYHVAEMIAFATGNLGRRGGHYKPNGLRNEFKPFDKVQEITTSVGTFELPDPVSYMALPASILPELIENGDIRAFITIGGNPLLSVGGEERIRAAFPKLELTVSIDIFRSATAEMSDYVLPATDWMERMDINFLSSNSMQPLPFIQFTDPLERPAHDRRHVVWTLSRLLQEMALPSPLLDSDPEMTDGVGLIEGLLQLRDLSIEKITALDHSTALLPEEPPEAFYEKCLQHPHKKVDCCPSAFVRTRLFERCEEILAELEREPDDTLKLISLRTRYMHNSWLANAAKFRRGKETTNPLNMCEADASARGLFNGDVVRISNEHGTIDSQILVNNDLRPGVVAMSHGYGHSRSFGLRVARQHPGANCNILMPTGPHSYEPLSYMSWLTAVPVSVAKL